MTALIEWLPRPIQTAGMWNITWDLYQQPEAAPRRILRSRRMNVNVSESHLTAPTERPAEPLRHPTKARILLCHSRAAELSRACRSGQALGGLSFAEVGRWRGATGCTVTKLGTNGLGRAYLDDVGGLTGRYKYSMRRPPRHGIFCDIMFGFHICINSVYMNQQQYQ